jgi:hypothetical protein
MDAKAMRAAQIAALERASRYLAEEAPSDRAMRANLDEKITKLKQSPIAGIGAAQERKATQPALQKAIEHLDEAVVRRARPSEVAKAGHQVFAIDVDHDMP